MKSLFNLDNPFFQMLSKIMDFIVLNLLFILCSLPVVTMGASLAALNKVMQDYVLDNEQNEYVRFFNAFKANFKQATLVWLVTLVVLAALVADFLLIDIYFSGVVKTILFVLLAILAIIVVGVLNFLFPLLVRYTNTVREHLYNAIILAVCKLPKTLLLVLISAIPLLLFVFSVNTLIRTLIFWVVIGISFTIFIKNYILRNVYRELERVAAGEGSISIMN